MRDFDIKTEVKADFLHYDGQWQQGRPFRQGLSIFNGEAVCRWHI